MRRRYSPGWTPLQINGPAPTILAMFMNTAIGDFVVSTYDADVRRASVGAVPLLELFGVVVGGWQMARAALAARRRLESNDGDAAFLTTKLLTARFYADHVLCRARGLCHSVTQGADAALAVVDDQF